MKIQVCLVSDQLLPNLIPALMDKPDKVILVSSVLMSERKLDTRLKSLLESASIDVEIFKDAPDTGLKLIIDYAYSLIESLDSKHPNSSIRLNVTGGTKLMAMGFADSFRGFAENIFYTDSAHRHIENLPDNPREIKPATPMHDVLNVRDYLKVQGINYIKSDCENDVWFEKAKSRKAVTKYLAKNICELDSFIGALNRLADLAFAKSEMLTSPYQSLDYAPHPKSPWSRALTELSKAGLIGWEEGSKDLIFIDADKTQYLRGGWLEEYAFHIIKDEKVFDVKLGVHVESNKSGNTHNEFDVLATHGNQLLFVECKTLRFNPDENDNEIAYKLDSLGKSARGLFGETWLLSARQPTDQLIERLNNARIRLIKPEELQNLRQLVQNWMNTKN